MVSSTHILLQHLYLLHFESEISQFQGDLKEYKLEKIREIGFIEMYMKSVFFVNDFFFVELISRKNEIIFFFREMDFTEKNKIHLPFSTAA